MEKGTLEQLMSTFNWWLGFSTIAVAIGILGEYVSHFIFEKDARKNKTAMAISTVLGLFVLVVLQGSKCGYIPPLTTRSKMLQTH